MLNVNTNQTVKDKSGRILFFGLKDFISEIVDGSKCFICGADPNNTVFNNEHVIPNWILKKFALHAKSITLPNGTSFKYGQYTVPCCQGCNSELSKVYEKPISDFFTKSYSEATQVLSKDSTMFSLIFRWLNLIFLKTHLKDKGLVKHLDKRRGEGFIGDDHYWEEMHHIHCLSRSHYSGAKIDDKVFGTVFIFPTVLKGDDHFDYIDNQAGKGVLLQLGEFTIIAILNDACAGYSIYLERLTKITGPLTEYQARQIFCDLNFININLKDRPIFRSIFSDSGDYKITVSLPAKPILVPKEHQLVTAQKLLSFYIEQLLPQETQDRQLILTQIEEGKRNYLWNDKDEFIDFSKSQILTKEIDSPTNNSENEKGEIENP